MIRRRRLSFKGDLLRSALDRLASVATVIVKGDVCAFPGCRFPAWEAHHIVPRFHDGVRWDLDNLIPLCRDHHDVAHEVPKGERDAWYAEKFGVDRLALLERAARNPRPDPEETKRALLEAIRKANPEPYKLELIEKRFDR